VFDQYRLPQAGVPIKPRDCARVLSLSGGGYRGLYTARLLARIEDMDSNKGQPIGSRFDVIAGTSVGGLIAAGLSVGMKAQEIYDILVDRGPAIFPPLHLKWWRKVFGRKVYDAKPLEDAIRACIGVPHSKTRLDEIETALLMPTVSWTRGEMVVLRTRGLDEHLPSTCSLLDACRATSAAPAHFPAHTIDDDLYVDGGLAANCPDLVALNSVNRSERFAGEPVRMLSVGTAGVTHESTPSKMPLRGLMWANPALNLSISAQEKTAIAECKHQLGNDYLRLNSTPGQQQKQLRDLDVANRDTTVALTALADKRFDELMSDSRQKLALDRLLTPIRI
jgi:uncharacterized protein